MYDNVIKQTENPVFPRSRFRTVGSNHFDVIVSRNYFSRPGGHYIPTPERISCRNATLNPKHTTDDQCFMLAELASFYRHEKVRRERISVLRKFIDIYDLSDITFPILPKHIRIWERKNNIRVDILGYQEPEIYIMKNDGDIIFF